MIKKNKNKLRAIFLVGILFFVLCFGFVSADLGCCRETNNQGFCAFVDEDDCKITNFFSEGEFCQSETHPYETENVVHFTDSPCEQGCCIDKGNNICMSSQTKISCENEGLQWKQGNCNSLDSPNPCEQGCCVINGKGTYETKMSCVSKSGISNLDFRPELNKLECRNLYRGAEKGACVSEEGTCTYGTRSECSKEIFKANTFCSDYSLNQYGVICTSHGNEKKCFEGDVYWFDSCNQREEIADTCERGQEICEYDECKSLACGNMKNGESECIYQGSIGQGYAPAGSLHWKKECINGEINYINCGEGRTGICQEKTTSNTGFTRAYCVPNNVEDCFGISSKYFNKIDNEVDWGDVDNAENQIKELIEDMGVECKDNPLCIMENNSFNGGRGPYFNNAMCVPKEPRKLEGSCELATSTCTVYFERKAGRWGCVGNCGCLEKDTFEDMNNLCVKMGDCGLYVNYKGEEGENNKLSYSPNKQEDGGMTFKEETIEAFDAIMSKNKGSNECESGFKVDGKLYCKKEEVEEAQKRYDINLPIYLKSWAKNFDSQTDEPRTEEKIIKNLEGKEKYVSDSKLDFKLPKEITQQILGNTEELTQQEIDNLIQEYISQLSSDFDENDFMFRPNEDYSKSAIRDAEVKWNSQVWGFLWNRKIKKIDITYNCLAWENPTGSTNCEKCNENTNNPMNACTKYQCESLGANCMLINADIENKAECISLDDDGTAPIVKKLNSMEGEDYSITKSGTIWKINKNIPENSKIKFNLELDELTRCRYGYESYPDYDSMPMNYPINEFSSPDNSFSRDHSFEIEIPSLLTILEEDYTYDAEENLKITIRCSDISGNFNDPEWIINYTAKASEDKDPPLVLEFEPENNKEFEYMPEKINLYVYLDEDAECKYDRSNKKYEEMQNNMSCFSNICFTNLTDNILGGNKLYIKCKDNNSNINDYIEYKYNIKRVISKEEYITEFGLKIDSITLENDGKIYYNEDNFTTRQTPISATLKVSTSQGIDNGKSTCYYGFSPNGINMYLGSQETSLHSKIFTSFMGNSYKIYIKCEDEVSSVTGNFSFKISIDNKAPNITSYTTERNYLTIFTDEPAKCSYNPVEIFEIEEGESFDFGYDFVTEQKVEWNPTTPYFIKCIDKLGNKGLAGTIGEGLLTAPFVTRIYYDSGNLRINTDKESRCYYDFNGCEFSLEENENTMDSSLTKEHSIEWNSATKYYIKCKDKWETENENCAVIIQPNSIF